jgi:hypothetical protein
MNVLVTGFSGGMETSIDCAGSPFGTSMLPAPTRKANSADATIRNLTWFL